MALPAATMHAQTAATIKNLTVRLFITPLLLKIGYGN
jgi:hypothetical protein